MARSQRKPILTSNNAPQLERQARRINRQQKQLDRELVNQMGQEYPAKLSGASGRGITLKNLKRLEPMTDMQSHFFDAYEDGGEDNIGYILAGSAGCGKTYMSLAFAMKDILDSETIYDKLIIVRGTTQVSNLGFLPGDIELKISKFADPYVQGCADLFGRVDAFEKLVDMGKIEFMCSSFLRGLNFENCIVYVDEASSLTWHELNTICTRVSKNCKIIISGDVAQNDLIYNRNEKSGWVDFLKVSDKLYEFQRFDFTSEDVVRSGFVRSWLTACESLGL